MSKSGRGEARVDPAGRVRPKAGAVQQSANTVSTASLRWSSGRRCLAVCWGSDCCAWRPTSLCSRRTSTCPPPSAHPPCRHGVRDHGREPRSHRRGRAVSARVSHPRRDIPARHGKKRGLDHSDPGLIATYRRYRRLRQEFAERSLVAPQFSCLGNLAGLCGKTRT
jgi:hypothetical protein